MANKSTMKRRETRKRAKAREGKVLPGISNNIPSKNRGLTGLFGVSQSIRRDLNWTYSFTASPAAGYSEAAVLIVNSPYDVDAALGGASAGTFAKYMALYSKCYTLGARVKVKFANSAAGSAGIPIAAYIQGVTITTNTTSLGSVVSAVQNGMCDYVVRNISPDSAKLEIGVDIAKFVDKPQILDDPQYFCTSAANPAQVIVAHVWNGNASIVTTGVVTYVIEVEMDCVFTDPIPAS